MPAPDRAALEAMKRSDLQKLCKDYGVKANLKTEAIIDLLLDSVHHPHPIHRPASSYNNRPGTIAPPARQSQPPPSTARLPRPTIARQSQPPPSSRRPPPSQPVQPGAFLIQATVQPTATSSRNAPFVPPVADQQHQASKPAQPPNSNKPVSRRVSSRSSTRARGVSTGSVIIHDTDDDNDDDDDDNVNYQPVPPPPVSEPAVVAPTPRTRKAKEMQTRLGVGRPVIAGGTGARKSSNIPKPTRIRPSRTVKTVEATIEEEVLPEAEPNDQLSPVRDQQTPEQMARPVNARVAFSSADPLDERIQTATQPLRDQIEAMNVELSRLKLLEAHWSAAQEKIATLSNQVQQLQNEVDTFGSLKAQFLELKTMISTGSISSAEVPHTSTPEELKKNSPTKESFVTPIGMSGIPSQPPAIAPHPGFAPRLLKRSHDSMSDISGFVEMHDDDRTSEPGANQGDAPPDKKRLKLTADTEASEPPGAKPPTNFHVSARAGYSIYTDVEPRPPPPSTGFDSPPPTDHLQLFGPGFGMSPDMTHDGPLIRAPMPPSDDASSNPEPFGYPFMPTSTPAHSFFPSNLGPFPFPQAPQSPSPVGPARHYPGLPSRRPKSQPRDGGGIKSGSMSDDDDDDDDDSDDGSEDDGGGAGSKQKDSASASKSPRKKANVKKAPVVGRTLSSTEIGTQMGMIPVPIREGETHDNLPITQTLYGTELENDSRFGDFGVEGVASGFWTGGRF